MEEELAAAQLRFSGKDNNRHRDRKAPTIDCRVLNAVQAFAMVRINAKKRAAVTEISNGLPGRTIGDSAPGWPETVEQRSFPGVLVCERVS
jgi:hypothetical protein